MMQVDGRRLVRALTLTALAFLLVGGVTGFALAQTEDADALAVPVPRPGDSATYLIRRGIDWDVALGGDGDAAMDQARYEWLPQEWIVDTDFTPRLAAPLRATYTYRLGTSDHASYSLTYYYDTTTHEPLMQAQEATSTTEAEAPSYGVGGPIDPEGSPALTTSTRLETFGQDLGACGVWTPIHGMRDGRVPFVATGPCGWVDPSYERPEARFVPNGWSTTRAWRGDEAQRSVYFDVADESRLGLWYANDSPFPVRLRISMAEFISDDWTQGRTYLLARGSFTRGTGEYGVQDPASVLPGLGAVPALPATPWMVDETGLPHSFPLKDAYAAALAATKDGLPSPVGVQDEGTTTVSDWLRSRPDGYLAFAVTINVKGTLEGEENPEWIMIWADGRGQGQSIAKRVSSTTETGGVLLPAAAGRHVTVEDWAPSWLPKDTSTFFPTRQQVPALAPAIAPLAERYRALAGPEAPLNRYGFQVYCVHSCDDVRLLVEVGVSTVRDDGQANEVTDPMASVLDKVLVAKDGRLAYRSRQVQSSQTMLGDGEPAVIPSTEYAGQSTSAAVWDAPSVPAAASIGFLAVVAGALYYFWPAAKAAGLGLFSRTRDDELLDHPRRAQVLQLVQAEPGIHFQDMCRRLGLGRGTLEHHLRKMLVAGLLTKVTNGGYSCYFPKGTVDRRLMAAAPLLRSESGRSILEAVRERPGLSGRQIALELGLSQSTVSYHLRRLEQAGLVFGAGAAAGVRLSPLGEQAAA